MESFSDSPPASNNGCEMIAASIVFVYNGGKRNGFILWYSSGLECQVIKVDVYMLRNMEYFWCRAEEDGIK